MLCAVFAFLETPAIRELPCWGIRLNATNNKKTSQGKRRPGLPRDRLCRSNGERLKPELSQTSQNASMRRCHPPPPIFFIPLPPRRTE